MREILFRAWDKHHKYMINDFHEKDIFQQILNKDHSSHFFDYIIEQYTGLTDKNGVKIFEGDIINVEYNYIGEQEVKFENGAYNIHDYKTKAYSVVGNIHENKENNEF